MSAGRFFVWRESDRRLTDRVAGLLQSHDGKVDLLVAIVQYKTILSVPRKGLTTSWLASLEPGERVHAVGLIRPFRADAEGAVISGARIPVRFDTSGQLRLPPSPAPLIMIGPGTGVAPFRALMEERIRTGAKGESCFFAHILTSSLADFWGMQTICSSSAADLSKRTFTSSRSGRSLSMMVNSRCLSRRVETR